MSKDETVLLSNLIELNKSRSIPTGQASLLLVHIKTWQWYDLFLQDE